MEVVDAGVYGCQDVNIILNITEDSKFAKKSHGTSVVPDSKFYS